MDETATAIESRSIRQRSGNVHFANQSTFECLCHCDGFFVIICHSQSQSQLDAHSTSAFYSRVYKLITIQINIECEHRHSGRMDRGLDNGRNIEKAIHVPCAVYCVNDIVSGNNIAVCNQ